MFYIKVANRSPLPYNISLDTIIVKIQTLEDRSVSYIENATINIYSNFTGTDELIGNILTNEYGVAEFRYSTDFILDKNIETGLVWATVQLEQDDTIYTSNTTRVNFINDDVFEFKFTIIDANNPYNRTNYIDNYIIIDANDPNNRTINSVDYNIYDRS